MNNYTIISIETAKQMLKLLKNRKLSLSDAYKAVERLMPTGWPALNDVYGLAGEAGSLALEGDGNWKQFNLNEEHWCFGEADLERIGCFRNNTDAQYLNREQMIRLMQGHIGTFNTPKAKPKANRTLEEAEREIARLQSLLRMNNINIP
jgi:hypothetical protein